MTWWKRTVLMVAVGLVGWWPSKLWADTTQVSNNYSINESEIGGTGDDNSASTNYSFKPGTDDGGSTLGDSFAGNSSSANYQSNAGFTTTNEPSLTFAVTSASVNLGTLSQLSAATGTATFMVKDYTSYGYTVTIVGTGLKSGAHTISPMTTDAASVAGSEQFGLNTVLDHSPANPVLGSASPVQVPSGSFSYGVSGDGATGTFGTTRPYTIDGQYRFNSGETIASAPKSSGETDYTATFLANIAPLTPGGTYQTNLTLIATGSY